MADIAGGLVSEAAITTSAPGPRSAPGADLKFPTSNYTSPPGERRDPATGTFQTIVTRYTMRARDSGLSSSYVTYTTNDPSSTPPGSPVGSWVEKTILDQLIVT